jgi:2-polyprenyl-3-methyl-5-hydroxy-6-metoxy-1,4-benzoquinol methylase
MSGNGKFMRLLRRLIDASWFRPVHLGHYIRTLHFRRQWHRLPWQRFRRILDAGCGQGDYSIWMARTSPEAEVRAVDICPPPSPANSPPNLFIAPGDLLQLASREEFDFIISIDVLEHIHDNPKVMLNFHRALKRGGYLFLHMPDDREQWRIFPERFFQDFNKWADHEHVGEQYSLEELSRLLSKMGFSILQAHSTFGLPGQLAWELDRLTDKHWRTKIILMPMLKLLAKISVHMRPRRGSLLVVAQK